MVWIVALALNALQPQLTQHREIACDLAPYFGRGASSEGALTSLSGLGLGCSALLAANEHWSLGPRLEFSEQHLSIYQKLPDSIRMNSYEARNLGIGLQSQYRLNAAWAVNYTLTMAQGLGSQEQNITTDNSSQNLRFSQLKQQSLHHALSLQHQLAPRLSWLAGIQMENARQSWDAANGQLRLENVGAGNQLSLTSSPASELGSEMREQAHYQSYSLRFGLSLVLQD